MNPEVATATAPFGVTAAQDNLFESIKPHKFTNPTRIDNPWLPLHPGKQLVFEGYTEEDGEEIPHRVLFTATDLTKDIAGIRAFVSYEVDYSAGDLVEAELVFFAQDDDGIVWHLGQHPEAYEDGVLVEFPTWIHGLEGARAGIMMQAHPAVGMPSYSQGWSPAVDYTDRAQIKKLGRTVTVPYGTFTDTLLIEEFSEPNAFQRKTYARGVGNIHVGWRGADATHETLELVDVIELNNTDLADVRDVVLALEAHAYTISQNSSLAYRDTAKMKRAPDPL
jgi:hypothetical protein